MNYRVQLLGGAAFAVLALAPALAAQAEAATVDAAAASGSAAEAGASSAPSHDPEPNTIKEVIITATKQGATNLQKTPLSVSVVSGDTLVQDNIKDARDLTQEVSSLKFTVNNVSPQIYIRGVGGFIGGEAESDVSMYLDGVYLERLTVVLQTDFNDLDRVEVLEGPQGVTFGRNAVGGAINFISRPAPNTFQFQDTLNVGSYNLFDDAFTVGGPITDKLQGSLSFSHVQHDPYVKNVNPGVGNVDDANRTGVRGQLRWEPTADITNTLRADYLWTHEHWITADTMLVPTTGLNSGSFPDPLQNSIIGDTHYVDMESLPLQIEQAYGVSDEFNWKLNDNWSVKSVTALRTDQSYNNQANITDIVDHATSGAYTVPPAMIGNSFGGPSLSTSTYREYQFSQEFNLLDHYGPLSGVIGYYAFDDHVRMHGYSYAEGGNVKTVNPASGSYTFQNTLQPTLSNAIFTSQTFKITDTISLTAGVRYTWEHKTLNTYNITTTYEPGAVPVYPAPGYVLCCTPGLPSPYIADLNQDQHATTPKLGLEWQVTPTKMLYVSASEGYKTGGFNYSARDTIGASFGPEELWAYEAGAKTDWFDHSLRFNIAGFYYIWHGLQFNSLISQTPSISSTSNADKATETGIEASIIWKPQFVPGLTLGGNTTLLNSDYNNFNNYAPPGGLPAIGHSAKCVVPNGLKCTSYNVDGNKLVNAPDTSVNLNAQEDWEVGNLGHAYARVEYQYTSRTYFDPTNAPIASQAPFSLVNASIGFHPAGSKFDFAIWGKNLTNQQVYEGYSAGSFVETTPGDPLTVGARINYKY
jgi:iron complex outermembrane receptor protein